MEYPKIETLFTRDENFKVTQILKMPVIETIKLWSVTEKIDGTNIRVILDNEGRINFGGRTDNANIPGSLLQYLFQTFTAEKMKEVFWVNDQPTSVVLYGEGYGAGIQKCGGNYNKNKSFRLFDVLIEDKWWLDWANTEDVATKLGIKTAPFIGIWTLDEIVERVKSGIKSRVAAEENNCDCLAEGVVGRTLEPLFDKRGRRLILKLKTKDFK